MQNIFWDTLQIRILVSNISNIVFIPKPVKRFSLYYRQPGITEKDFQYSWEILTRSSFLLMMLDYERITYLEYFSSFSPLLFLVFSVFPITKELKLIKKYRENQGETEKR